LARERDRLRLSDLLPGLSGAHAATILGAEWPLLLAAAALLAASIGIDAVFTGERRAFVEDGSKLAGIVLWLAFYARTAHRWIARG
jgi:hypothetical protein